MIEDLGGSTVIGDKSFGVVCYVVVRKTNKLNMCRTQIHLIHIKMFCLAYKIYPSINSKMFGVRFH